MIPFPRILVFLIAILTFQSSIAQSSDEIPSLLKQLDSIKVQSDKILVYRQLSRKYFHRNTDSALLFANKGLYLAEQMRSQEGIGDMHALLGDLMVVDDDFHNAREHYQEAIESYSATGNLNRVAHVDLVLGNICFVQDNYPEAMDFYTRGKKLADSLQLLDILPDLYNNIGNIYFLLDDRKISLDYFNKAIELFERVGKLDNKQVVMINMITIHISLKEYKEARDLAMKVLHYADSVPSAVHLLSPIYSQLGDIEFREGNNETALEYYHKSLDAIVKSGNEYMGPSSVNYASAYFHIGNCDLTLGNYGDALINLKTAYKLAGETGQMGVIRDASEALTAYYEHEGRMDSALFYHKAFQQAADSINNDEALKNITRITLQFEFEQKLKEKELEQARREAYQKRKEIIYRTGILGFFVALLFLFLVYRLQVNRIKRNELESKNLKLDLEFKNKELTTNVMYLLKKNEFIINISDKLKKARFHFKPDNRTIVDEIIKEIEASSKEHNWKDFELRFQEVHSEFYQKLNELFPDLTPNELKICAFLRLNMTTKEISSVTFQTYNSIIMARHRLRKKLNIDSNENLSGFLRSL